MEEILAREDMQNAAWPAILDRPQISLVGDIDKYSVQNFLEQLGKAELAGGDVALDLTTLGGDPEMARRIVLEITIMSAFPCGDRWLSRDTMLMIHGRKLDKTIELSGPIRASIPMVEALLAQLRVGIDHEEENFARLIDGCDVSPDEVRSKALHNWYLGADEAYARGLVAGIVGTGPTRAGS